MDNWVFWIVLVFLAVMGIMGLTKGFVKMLFSIVSIVAAMILTIIFSPYVADFLKDNTKLYVSAQEKTHSFIEDVVLKAEEGAGESKTISDLPLPDIIKDMLMENNNEETYSEIGANSLGDYLSICITNIIVNAIAYCGTFLVLFAVIKLLTYLLDLLSKLPLINEMNKLLGFALGLLEGFLILWLICIVITACANTEWGQYVLGEIQRNQILNFIYNNNYLMRLVTDVLKLSI